MSDSQEFPKFWCGYSIWAPYEVEAPDVRTAAEVFAEDADRSASSTEDELIVVTARVKRTVLVRADATGRLYKVGVVAELDMALGVVYSTTFCEEVAA